MRPASRAVDLRAVGAYGGQNLTLLPLFSAIIQLVLCVDFARFSLLFRVSSQVGWGFIVIPRVGTNPQRCVSRFPENPPNF